MGLLPIPAHLILQDIFQSSLVPLDGFQSVSQLGIAFIPGFYKDAAYQPSRDKSPQDP